VELRAYVRTLLRRWWIPVGFGLIAGAVAYVFALQSAPVYRATAQLSILPSVVDYFTGEAVQRLLNNYSLQLRSRAFAGLAAEELNAPSVPGGGRPAGAPLGADQLQGRIKAVAAPSEYRIAVEVDDADPERARDIANAAARAFVVKIRADNAGREKRDIEVQILDPATTPGSPVSPRPRRDALGAALLGGALGVGVVFLVEYLDFRRPRAGPGGTGPRPGSRRRRPVKRRAAPAPGAGVTERTPAVVGAV
jgi:receptor protein-tyrosine kinase